MKCPMLTMYAMTYKKPEEFKDRDCLKEECAWWQREIGNCIIYQMGMEVGTLCCLLEQIADRLPPGEQSRN